jgi:glutamate:Na+ symporter, ESS family
VILGILLIVAKWFRLNIKILQKYFIPTSLIAGLLGLILKENLIFKFITHTFKTNIFKYNLISSQVQEIWMLIPSILITIIFASLFIGKDFSHFKKLWKITKSQIAFAQVTAWGQYVVGFLVTLLILVPFFNGNVLSAALIEISFEGGHGAAAGMVNTFNDLGFPEGADLSIALATFGILSGIVTGIILLNWRLHTNKTNLAKNPNKMSDTELKGIYPKNKQPKIALTTRPHSIESFSIHLAFILVAIGIGMIIQQGMIQIENLTWSKYYDIHILTHVPLFPIAMIGGVIVQFIISKTKYHSLLNRDLILRIQSFSLDFLIVTSVASISLDVIGEHIWTFLILALAGFLWNTLSFLFLAPRMIHPYWFERGITDYGQSMAMTTVGLLLLQIVDPDKETPAFETFGYKQLLFEPFVGGGVVTAASLPLIAEFGPYLMFVCSLVIFFIFLFYGLYNHKKEIMNK